MMEASTWPVDGITEVPAGRPMRRYTPADREAAYQLWRATAGKNQRQTAAIMGIPSGTIQQWAENEDWAARSEDEDASAATSIDRVARAMVAPLFVQAVITVGQILGDPSANANARVRAAELAAGWNGLVVPKAGSVSLTQHQDGSASVTVKLGSLDSLPPDQLARLRESGYLPPALPSDTDVTPE